MHLERVEDGDHCVWVGGRGGIAFEVYGTAQMALWIALCKGCCKLVSGKTAKEFARAINEGVIAIGMVRPWPANHDCEPDTGDLGSRTN